jgi:glycosyltransferase involved in cell wall biosynthesis
LLTDVWFKRVSVPGRRSAGRFHPALDRARVYSWNGAAVARELWQRARGQSGWEPVIARNHWFQRAAVGRLRAIRRRHPGERFVFFSYSYAARSLFEFAKENGWLTVLGQIDPGRAEEEIVASLERQTGLKGGSWMPAPDAYWDEWRAECALADRILVNSEWSRQGLMMQGVPEEKLRVTPLVFEPSAEACDFERSYPASFTAERPLRILFLGQVCLRKGIRIVMEAADRLAGLPVEIQIVGPIQIPLTSEQLAHSVLRWIGSVPRSAVGRYYREADLFLFPTFSDGFGLTQLEAQAWKLPLVVSRFCGQVIENGVNGLVLDPLSTDALTDTIRHLLKNPGELPRMASRAELRAEHKMDGLADRLLAVTS